MTPEQLARAGTESAHQTAFMSWCQQYKADPRVGMTFASANGGLRDKVTAARMKASGVKAGVPDVFVPIPVLGKHHGLWIEFKKPGIENHKDGGLKPEQVKYRDYLVSQNYAHVVVYSYLQAIDATLEYLACQFPQIQKENPDES